jgi:hypothetical protein
MTERKVLIVRVKGGMQIVQGVTNYIIEGLVRGVLVLPEEVITSYAIEEFPALGVENEDTIYTVVPEGVPVIKILNKDDVRPIGAFVQVQEESEQRDGSEAPPEPAPQPTEPATPFKPKGAMAEIKREVFIRLQAYQQRTKLGWAQRVSDATGGKVAPDVVRRGLLEARDIGVDRWKLIGKALDKLEEEMEK